MHGNQHLVDALAWVASDPYDDHDEKRIGRDQLNTSQLQSPFLCTARHFLLIRLLAARRSQNIMHVVVAF